MLDGGGPDLAAGTGHDHLPVIDLGPLLDGGPEGTRVAEEIDAACRSHGFFIVVGHRVDPGSLERLDAAAREFFALADEVKARIAMPLGGRAWRGWFPTGGELTSGVPDRKEGLYFGTELAADDPRVRAGLPLHGPNQWPDEPAELRPAVATWMAEMTRLGQTVLSAMAVGLGLSGDWFERHLTADPTILFRIFRYPPVSPDPSDPAAVGAGADREGRSRWGVAEHTDYGLLTLLAGSDLSGLEVRTKSGWLAVPPVPGAIVCNLGDMLERITDGRYRSTPHRVHPPSEGDRLSFPFFMDPSWDAPVSAIPLDGDPDPADPAERWDGTDLRELRGTYGEYLTTKVSKVFPGLHDAVLGEDVPAGRA